MISEAYHQQTKWKVAADGEKISLILDDKYMLTCLRCVSVMPFYTRVSIIAEVRLLLLLFNTILHVDTTASFTDTRRTNTNCFKSERCRRL